MAVLDLLTNNIDRFHPAKAPNFQNIDFLEGYQPIALDNFPDTRITADSPWGESALTTTSGQDTFATKTVDNLCKRLKVTDTQEQEHLESFKEGFVSAIKQLKGKSSQYKQHYQFYEAKGKGWQKDYLVLKELVRRIDATADR